jgi:hypothetical protein
MKLGAISIFASKKMWKNLRPEILGSLSYSGSDLANSLITKEIRLHGWAFSALNPHFCAQNQLHKICQGTTGKIAPFHFCISIVLEG